MTTTSTTNRRRPPSPATVEPGRTPLPTQQRRPLMAAVAVLLIVAGALGGLEVLSASKHQESVLVIVKAIPAGHPIESTDLTTALISGNVAYTPAADRTTVVGRTAARDLFVGQLLTHSMLAVASVPDAGHALVGLELKAGQVPSVGVDAGDTVELLATTADNTSAPTDTSGSASTAPDVSAASVVVAVGTIFATQPDANGAGGALVTVLVPRAQAEQLAILASAGAVSLIRVGS